MIALIVLGFAVVFFLVWYHTFNRCAAACWGCDTLTVVYSLVLIFLTTALIYFLQ